MVTAEGISAIVTPGVLGVSIMIVFAQFVGLGPTEHDGLLAAGLVIAAVVLAIFAFKQLRIETSKARTRVVGVFALIGIASIAWAGSEPVFRLINLQRTNDTIASIHEFCLGLSDSDLASFGVPLDTDTWERMPADGYGRFITQAKSEGKLREGGGQWDSDGQLVDSWEHPFRIAVSLQGGKRFVIVDSLGPDGRAGSLDDIQLSGN